MSLLKNIIFIVFFLQGVMSFGQENAVIFGKITDAKNKPLELVNVSISGLPGGSITDKKGKYELKVPANKQILIIISFVGYQREVEEIFLAPGEKKEINKSLKVSTTVLPDVVIEDKDIRNTNLTRIDPISSVNIPTVTGGIEQLLHSQALGVSSSNELTSQYTVRGGNYDENLVYVNGIEVYRPFLIRSGQQEGLSFLNPDLVSSVLFSSGGFDAKYGDKMSSVLDIQYKKPVEFGASFAISLLGGSAHIEGATDDLRLSYLLGVRHKSNQYILKGLETKGEYKPSFNDVQAVLMYQLSEKVELSVLGNYARNSYKLKPENRETDFGTIQDAHRLKIYFDGQELDRFETLFGAFSTTFKPKKNLQLKFICSAFQTYETETFDIQGQYWIGTLETDFGDDNFGDVIEAQGVGTYLNHARNILDATVFNIEHKGSQIKLNNFIQWGVKYQREIINDKLNEWEMIDSAGYSIPHIPGNIGTGYSNPSNQPNLELHDIYKLDTAISSNRYSGFIQNTWKKEHNNRSFALNTGVRVNYWDFNGQLLISPRATFSYKPDWKKDILFRFSTGVYSQPPFYRELRDIEGNINPDVKAQTSIHFVLGSDWNFIAWSRPFKFVTEIYYKYLDNLIPYEVDNVRIKYYANNNAHGYATGIDMKVNGEFVRGIESWVSLSIMKTEEDIEDDFYYDYYNSDGVLIIPGYTFNNVAVDSVRFEPGYIPRPTDQRVNFCLYFQDYLPRNPSYKMHLNLVFGSSLPFGPPDSEKFKHTLRMPPYRRVDIGFSKEIIGENTIFSHKNPLKYFKSLWITLEVFNLLQVNNTISYLWVTDVTNRKYAVPNYLTPRQLNIKLIANF